MIIYKDILSGDELISDSYDLKEIEDGFFFEVEGKWEVVGDVEIDIGANPSAEGGDEEGVDSGGRKVVNLIDAFNLQEGPSFSKKDFMAYLKPWCGKIVEELTNLGKTEEASEFKTKSATALKYLVGKVKDLQFFTSVNMDPDTTMVYAYYKEGAGEPTFLYPKYALKAEKV